MDGNPATDDETDEEEIFDIGPLKFFDEKDLHKLLNRKLNEAHKCRTHEFHPDKNTADTTGILQAMKLANATLYDEKQRSLLDTKLSDSYKQQIDHYLIEYENLSFSNNFHKKLEEIIDQSISNSDGIPPIDDYIQCAVCHQFCKDISVHEHENCEPYEKMFNDTVKSLPIEQIIGSDIWNWKAIERTSVHLPIWTAREKWSQISRFISQLKEPVRIICTPERYWTLLIDTYEQHKRKLVKLPTLLAQTTIVNYLPDSDEIQNLKATFDKYDQVEQLTVFSKLQKNDQRVESGSYYLFDINTTNKYIDRNDFYLPIADPPSEIYREYCYDCQKTFTFFLRHHHCRMCGQQFCDDCLIYKRIPHLGFIIKPVRICHKCSDEKEYFIYQHIFTYVKHLIQSNRLQYLNIYLALLHLYKTTGDELFYRQTGEYFYQTEKYSLVLQCFTYAHISNEEWFRYSIEFCKKSEYLYSFTCMKLCAKSEDFWFEQAETQHNLAFTLLCYEYTKISMKKLFEIASQKLSNDINTCLVYLLYLNIKHVGQINWKEFGEQILLRTEYDGSLAMFCFHLYGKMQNDQWNRIAEQLCQANQFEKLAYLLANLYHIKQIHFQTSQISYIYFLTKILLNKDRDIITLDDWLNDICDPSKLDINRIIIGLSIAYDYKYTSWIEYKNQYIERKEYYKVLICHKMSEYLTQNIDTQWFINAIEDLDPIGYELFDSSDWQQLGDQYFQNEKFIIALNCYLFCEQKQIDQIIIQQAQALSLPLSTALLYDTVAYKRTRGNNSKVLSKNNSVLCNDTFYDICFFLYQQKNSSVLELVISAINMYETDNRFRNIDLFKYHLLILNELDRTNDEIGRNDRLINGGVHILTDLDNLSNECMNNLASLKQMLRIKSNIKVFNELKFFTYKSCPEFMMALLNPNNYFPEQLKQLLQECLDCWEISNIQPPEYRSKMYLIQAMIFKLENDPVQALSSVHNAVLSYPNNLVMFSVVLFMNHSSLHSAIRRSLINDITNNSLNLTDINPTTQMKHLNFSQGTDPFVLLKKYEDDIVQQITNNNPIQIALSYIDLIMVISGNVTLYPISLTMSCLYFYKAMTNDQCTLAELYAYRSIIFDISIEVFVYTRHYLSLYVQMYIYKLLYTVILRSSDLFAKRIESTTVAVGLTNEYIIKDIHETMLNELVKNILQLSKVNPLTHALSTSISMIHDMVYMECTGNELLAKYLKLKLTNSSIYEYYYFEGVWKGWIDEKKFVEEREKCMQDLLNDYDWTMDDVENLLCQPLIPRTEDGWLFNAKHRLQLEQPAYSQVIGVILNNDTGDIEFMFTQAKKNEHNLFDASDVMDILTNGIVDVHFTLDPPSADYHSHPFYQMKYLPKRLSKTPNYLFTLLHTDYLLKMISTGVEICSRKPFKIRSSAENLMQRLPIHIREELQGILIKKTSIITDSIHCFWIQPESTIEYEEIVSKTFFGRTNDNIKQFYLSDDIKMCVKQREMKYDDKNETNDQHDQSVEAQFARIFTKYYDEIGKYFPELLRLKELFKLSILSRIIQAKYKRQCELISQIENDSTLNEYLLHIKRKLLISNALSNKSDEKILNRLSKTLCEHYFCKKSDLKPYIMDWYKSDQDKPLLQYLKQSLIQQKSKLKITIEKLNFVYDISDDIDDQLKCSWVPAAFSSDSNMKVYGGIILNANIKRTTGIKEVHETSKTIVKVDANKLSANLDKQKLKQQRNKNNTRKGESHRDGSLTTGKKPLLDEVETGLITYSKTKIEARRKALKFNDIKPDTKPLWMDKIDNENSDIVEKLKDKRVAELSSCSWNNHKSKLMLEVYQHSNGYLVCLHSNSARVTDDQKAHFNVFYEKNSGREETDQHHNFDMED